MPWYHDIVAVGTNMGYVRCCVCSPDEDGVAIYADHYEAVSCDRCGRMVGGEHTGTGRMKQGDRPVKRSE